ncbi:hypothetical protein [Streptomyces sp. TRM75563]|nr:hypothetical protein [Streptomyces sp. TRM75563]MCI4042827.1 hypothetical protein [Streptomyces sp. TRM75563]
MPGRAWLMLALATVGFAVDFRAWALLARSALGSRTVSTCRRSSSRC